MEQTQERTQVTARGRFEPDDGATLVVERVARRARPAAALRAAMVPIIGLALALVVALGFLFWHDRSLYVTTDIAQVTGPTVEVTSPAVGQVRTVEVDVGDQVMRDQVVATISIPRQVWLRSPIDGVVVARLVTPGDTVAIGRSMVTIADPTLLWVQAQVEETQVVRVHPGQYVEATVDALGTTLPGKVVAVGRAAASYLRPPTSGSSSFIKARQFVPVKIELDYGDLPLVLGGSVWVRIRVEE